jgi:hypothetical protein
MNDTVTILLTDEGVQSVTALCLPEDQAEVLAFISRVSPQLRKLDKAAKKNTPRKK